MLSPRTILIQQDALYVAALAICAISICFYYVLRPPKGLPPGMTGIQCLLQIPNGKSWLRMLEVNRKYGDIASGSFLGFTTIVIGSAKIAEDLLEKRGLNYADRPRSVMGGELCGRAKYMLLAKCDNMFREHRKWVAQEIGSHGSVKKSHSLIEYETRRCLRSLRDDPERAQDHLRKSAVSILSRIACGYVTKDGEDSLVDLARLGSKQMSMSTSPGVYYVDLLPLLKYIPSWLPGAGFKRRAKVYSKVARDAVEVPFRHVKAQLAAGTAPPSMMSRLLSQPDHTEEFEESVKWAGAVFCQASAGAASSTAYGFYLAMTLYPHVLQKAQAELDAVVGTQRLPTFTDRPSLPYLEAVYTELLRWHCPAPFTLRCAREDDSYDGYFIPAGAFVIANLWGILHDERTYPDPFEFKPERFLGENPEQDPRNACFGFGRRRCPGVFFSHSAVWLLCAQSLAIFDISKCIESGVEITPEVEMIGEVICHQAPFKCSIKPRSEEALALLDEAISLED